MSMTVANITSNTGVATSTASNGELSAEEVILSRIAALEQSLLLAEPNIRLALLHLHRDVQARPDLAHILKEEDIGTIFKATEIVTRQKIVTETVSKGKVGISGKTSAQLKNTSVDDL